ncbi:MAG: hypothetical protein QOJ15_4296 [Bradyrhizobium sp.]|jgi:hypothetical protein|nr:hypothetical protein [Bradyrhizobium sp.]
MFKQIAVWDPFSDHDASYGCYQQRLEEAAVRVVGSLSAPLRRFPAPAQVRTRSGPPLRPKLETAAPYL